jgi:phenylacetate-CoA ligase
MDYWKKLLIKRIIRICPLYKKTYAKISKGDPNNNLLKRSLSNALTNVPYYRNKYGNGSIDDNGLDNFLILRKSDIANNEGLFISDKYNKKILLKKSTGGTTGISLKIFSFYKSEICETAYIDYAFSLITKGSNLRVAVLRGNKPSSGIFEYKYRHLLLSSYDLSKTNVKYYVGLLKKYKINCLFVYPSSLHLFCKYLVELGNEVELPQIKGILSSSEILSTDDKNTILKIFPDITLIDRYGQNEHVAMAISINKGYYKFFDSYGYVEFINKGILKQNRTAEIVGTNYFNDVMPLIRYATDDYVEIDSIGNIVSIIGRKQDFIINKHNEIVPCIFSERKHTLENVLNFQYYQDKVGILEYRVITNNKFGKKDIEAIEEDLKNSFGNKIDPIVQIVNAIDKTETGKQKRLIQKIIIPDFDSISD